MCTLSNERLEVRFAFIGIPLFLASSILFQGIFNIGGPYIPSLDITSHFSPYKLGQNLQNFGLVSTGSLVTNVTAIAHRIVISTPQERDNHFSGCRSSKSGFTLHLDHKMTWAQKVYKVFLQTPANETKPGPLPVLLKYRFHKQYRHPSLDVSLTKARVAGEARALLKCLRCVSNISLRQCLMSPLVLHSQ